MAWILLRDIYLFLLLLNFLERLSATEFIFDWMRWYVVIGTLFFFCRVIFFVVRLCVRRSSEGKVALSKGIGPKTNKITNYGSSDLHPQFSYEYAVSEMQGWRESMEDCSLCITQLDSPLTDASLFAVFDGHGGTAVSKLCAQYIPEEICRQAQASQDLEAVLENSYIQVDRLIANKGFVFHSHNVGLSLFQNLSDPSSERGSGSDRINLYDFVGCTAVCVIIRNGTMTVANAGDSRALLCRKGELIELSHDHKPESPRERSRIEKAGGRVTAMGPCFRVDWGLNLSRSLGDFAYKKNGDLPASEQKISAIPDLVVENLTSDDDFIVLACDGIFELMTSQQVIDFVKDQFSRGILIDKIVENLLDICCSKDPSETFSKGTDNETCIIIKFAHATSTVAVNDSESEAEEQARKRPTGGLKNK